MWTEDRHFTNWYGPMGATLRTARYRCTSSASTAKSNRRPASSTPKRSPTPTATPCPRRAHGHACRHADGDLGRGRTRRARRPNQNGGDPHRRPGRLSGRARLGPWRSTSSTHEYSNSTTGEPDIGDRDRRVLAEREIQDRSCSKWRLVSRASTASATTDLTMSAAGSCRVTMPATGPAYAGVGSVPPA